jgi:hypothetical protein
MLTTIELEHASRCGSHQTSISNGGCAGCSNYKSPYEANGGCQTSIKEMAQTALTFKDMLETLMMEITLNEDILDKKIINSDIRKSVNDLLNSFVQRI